MKILCWFKGHEWSEWMQHMEYKGFIYRYCKRCGKEQVERLYY